MVSAARKQKQPRPGRVVAIFGPKGSGKSTIVTIVCAASRKHTVIASVGALEKQRLYGAPVCDVQFVEVHSPDEARQVVESGALAEDGVAVKVMVDGWQVDDPDWDEHQRAYEEMFRAHSVRQATVINQYRDGVTAGIGLARAAHLRS